MMDVLSAMEVFVRVAECGSFSRAAESLDQGKATVTTSVRNLEKHLGVILINRDTRRMRLTEEGVAYLEGARTLLTSVNRTEDELRAMAGKLRGQLHILTSTSIGHAFLCPNLHAFSSAHPDLNVALTLGHALQDLSDVVWFDAMIGDHPGDADAFVASPICETRHAVYCTPAFAGRLPPHPRDLDPRWCVGELALEQDEVRPWALTRGVDALQLVPAGSLLFSDSSQVLEAAVAGIGVACATDLLAQPYLASGALIKAYPDWIGAPQPLYLVIPKARFGAAKVQAFAQFVFGLAPPDCGASRYRSGP